MNQETANYIMQRMSKYLDNSQMIKLKHRNNVFLNCKGNLTANQDYNKCLKKVIRKIGIVETFSVHNLRHTFATRCIEAGMKPKALQKILGHENIATTMDLYVHIDEQELAQEMKLIENVV